MAFQPVPGTAEFVAHYTYQGASWVNTFYAFKSGSWSDVDLQAATDAMAASLVANMKPLLSNTITYTGVTSRGLREEFDVYASNTVGAGIGASAFAISTPQASYCLTRYSALTGRSARGRVYLPAPATNQYDTNNKNLVTAAYRDAAIVALQDLVNDMEAIDWSAVIVSRQQSGLVLPEAQTFFQVGWRARDLRIDTQRRRLVPNG